MKLSAAPVVAVSLLGMAGLSHARTFTSPALPTGTNTAGACYFRNVGSAPISLQVSALLNFRPGLITPTFQSCNAAPLAAGRTCVLVVDDLPDDVGFSCTAEVSGSGKSLRAAAELRDLGNNLRVIAAENLR